MRELIITCSDEVKDKTAAEVRAAVIKALAGVKGQVDCTQTQSGFRITKKDGGKSLVLLIDDRLLNDLRSTGAKVNPVYPPPRKKRA